MNGKGRSGASRADKRAGNAVSGTGGKDERCGFADDTSYREDNAGHDTGHCRGKDNAEHCAHLARAEPEASFAVAVRNGEERLLSGSDNQRKDHHCEGDNARHHGESPAEGDIEHQVSEQTEHDGRKAFR